MSFSKSTSRSSSSNNEKNICVICLEPLLKVKDDDDDEITTTTTTTICDIGTTVPCGHPCHVSCFNSWAEYFKKTDSDNDGDDVGGGPSIPCPTCQQSTKSFVKIFLRPEIGSSNFNNNKSSSCCSSSIESDEDEDIIVIDDASEQEVDDNKKTPATKPAPTTGTKRKHNKNDGGRRKKTTLKNYKKSQYYKERWLTKIQEVRALKLEAKNRKKCHHEDLVDLERSQLLNFRLMKQLESTIKAAKFSRNAVACFCFGMGWYLSKKFASGS